MAARVVEHEGCTIAPVQPTITPAHERQDHLVEIEALGGEPVLEPGWALGVGRALEDPGSDQLLQPTGEHGGRHPDLRLDLVEAAHAEERLTQDEERPMVADLGERTLHRVLGRTLRTIDF